MRKLNLFLSYLLIPQENESRRRELPTEPRMGQAFTPASEISPDEGFRREAETSINSMFLVVLK